MTMLRNGLALAAFTMFGSACLGLMMGGGKTQEHRMLANSNFAAKPPDCDVSAIPKLPSDVLAKNYILLGQIRISNHESEEAQKELREIVCKWGGDSVMLVAEPAGRIRQASYVALRKPGEGEDPRLLIMGISDSKLKEKVSFDANCPTDRITIVKKREDQGSGDYVVEACDETLRYSRTGSVYHPEGRVPGMAPAEPEPAVREGKLAILPMVGESVPKETRAILDELLANTVHDLSRFEVITQSDVETMIGYETMKDQAGCDDVTCWVEIAGAIGSDYVLVGHIAPLGTKVVIALKLVDVGEQRVEVRKDIAVENAANKFPEALAEVARSVLEPHAE